MSILIDRLRTLKAPRVYYLLALLVVVVWSAISIPALKRSRQAAISSQPIAPPRVSQSEIDYRAYSPAALKDPMPASVRVAGIAGVQTMVPDAAPNAAAKLRIVRTASMEIMVPHPVETADQITQIAERLGGYLVSADGQIGSAAHVTVRVPVAKFEEVRAEIRQLGVKVENEKFDAQDVTRQYVDREASLRNLQAQEMQYLEILKRANEVNTMLMVTRNLSEVRGEIEKLQAEANSSWEQAETVSIAVSLMVEAPQPVSQPDWRPLYELRTAVNDGLSSVIDYAATVITILLYLPAALLWTGTLLLVAVLGSRTVQWIRRRWTTWTASQSPIQG